MTAERLRGLLFNGILLTCALTVTGLAVRRELVSTEPKRPGWREIDGWIELLSRGDWHGSTRATIKIVEFTDFQCPFCRQVAPTLRAIRNEFPDHIAISYRHLPLREIHPHAERAAVAAECAREQGRFEPMHDVLFRHQDSIGVRPFLRYAIEAGVRDTSAFQVCMASSRHTTRIAQDLQDAAGLKLRGTPVVILDGYAFMGAPDLSELRQRIVALLRPDTASNKAQLAESR